MPRIVTEAGYRFVFEGESCTNPSPLQIANTLRASFPTKSIIGSICVVLVSLIQNILRSKLRTLYITTIHALSYIKLYYNTHRYIPNISIHIIIVYTFYIEKTRSDLSPFHSFSKMQIKERGGGYLITRYSKILESLLNREKTETLRIYIHIRFNQV